MPLLSLQLLKKYEKKPTAMLLITKTPAFYFIFTLSVVLPIIFVWV